MSKLAIGATTLLAVFGAGHGFDLPLASLSRETDCLWPARRPHRRANRHLALGVSACMTEYLIALRAAIILWTSLAVMPPEIVFDVIEAELERRGVEL
jgi:hypothetical protein